ncbi:hypoxanthine phosphoribosyltransferase 1 [Physocladia obscura]|uniref:Hypoxanthine phosphoribosyltransferase 1 n=1 Tax=Physocladia obscura TaxID=109957 RepID=A0AAD5X811_9FUNG|nr:hypoxanthine phosphoribosyltransferase 1 [Physocladia obscura]
MSNSNSAIHVEEALPKAAFVIPAHYEEDVESVRKKNLVFAKHRENQHHSTPLPDRFLFRMALLSIVSIRLPKILREIIKARSLPAAFSKGIASVFYADLMNALRKTRTKDGGSVQFSYEFAKVKSYHNSESTGNVKISLSEEELILYKGKHLLIVEDIIDTGITMVALLEKLKTYQPASVKVVSMLLKRTERSNGYVPDHYGFSIPDHFVIGYGLDYNEVFREMEHICIISKSGIEKYKQ